MTTTRTIAVVGAGMAGMASAARLAALGHNVTVFEQRDTFGGKLATYERDGFVFDLGPSLFTIPAVYRDLFLKTGAALDDVIELVDLEPAFRYRFADGTVVTMPGVDVAKCADALGAALGDTAAEEWRAFMSRASDMWSLTREPFMSSPLQGLKTLLPLARNIKDVRTIAPWKSLRTLGQQYFSDPRLTTLLDRYATYTGSDPRRAPAALATVPYVEQTFGAFHIKGGLGKLGAALYQRCIDRGVTFRFNCDVETIMVDDRARGVRLTTGEEFTADIVIANADATHVYRNLLVDLGQDQRRMKPLRALSKTTPSLSGFTMLLAVNGKTEGLEHHNVWFPQDYDDEFDCVFGYGSRNTAQPVPDPTIYACVPKDELMAPPGHEAWFILVNAPRAGDVNWDAPGLARDYADNILHRLAQRGVDLRERVLWQVITTPADLERSTRAPGGSIYGTSSNGARAAFLRPANQTPIDGLYLVGGSSHPGGGLPLVGLSAQIVTDLIRSN